jgi:hypothetical protein
MDASNILANIPGALAAQAGQTLPSAKEAPPGDERDARLGAACGTQSAEAKSRSDVRLAKPAPPLLGTMVNLSWVMAGRSSCSSSC